MIPVSQIKPTECIFTHILPNGENINIAAERLRMRCIIEQPEIHFVPINPHFAKSFVAHNSINFNRLIQLKGASLIEPVIFGHDGKFTEGRPDVFLIDGHHRYYAHFLAGMPAILAWLLEQSAWRPFTISNLAPITKEQLAAIPTTRLGEIK